MTTMRPVFGYLGAILLVVLASLLCTAVQPYLAPANMVMVFLLAVVLAATRLGLKAAILTAFLSVVAFDLFFVPPRFSLRVADTEYLITFFALFVVGVVISTLVARLGEKIAQLKKQEARTGSLYYLTRDLAIAADEAAVVEALRHAVSSSVHARLTVVLNRGDQWEQVGSGDGSALDDADMEIVHWVTRSGRYAGAGTAAFADVQAAFFPIKAGGFTIGVLVIDAAGTAVHENRQLIEAFAAQAAMAFERVQLARQAEEARLLREKSHLEQALLNSISHDLRTPLVTISGVLDTLQTDNQTIDPVTLREMVVTASEETRRLNRFVGNLLDMTRLEAGVLPLRLIPCDAEEIIGCALDAVASRANHHQMVTVVAPDLPPVRADVALLTQALVNLLDNAIKYAPHQTEITLSAQLRGEGVVLRVADCGPGVPAGEEGRIFDRFYRLDVPEKTGGTGLGLAIAKGIVDAHNGSITAANRPQGGLMVEVLLPATAYEEAAA